MAKGALSGELCQRIESIYNLAELDLEAPLFITGYLGVGMGQTFMGPE